jgi:hypothetical protein
MLFALKRVNCVRVTNFTVVFLSDIDECSYRNGDCSQKCSNTVGSRICSCFPGYILNEDGMKCDGIPPTNDHLSVQQ